jgi:hypothetical protein
MLTTPAQEAPRQRSESPGLRGQARFRSMSPLRCRARRALGVHRADKAAHYSKSKPVQHSALAECLKPRRRFMGGSPGGSARRVSSAMSRREVGRPNGTEGNVRSVPRGTSLARQTITTAAGAVAAAARSRMPYLRHCLSRLYAARARPARHWGAGDIRWSLTGPARHVPRGTCGACGP